MKQDFALKIIEKTRKDYDQIASSYHQTKRPAVWQASQDLFLEYIKKGDTVLDLGCGDGRLAKLISLKEVSYFGADFSKKMIEIAQKNYGNFGQFKVMSSLSLPYPDNCFNLVYAIGMLHHVPSQEFRLQILKEIKRVLKPYGYLIMTNWYLFKKPFLSKIIKQNFKKIFFLTPYDFNDIPISWKKGQTKTVERYYHAFTQTELFYLIERSRLKNLKSGLTYFQSKPRNIYTIAQKTVLQPILLKKEINLADNAS
jgi:ubiquinone/menaquinone biosynthesis C-methylase UbiE